MSEREGVNDKMRHTETDRARRRLLLGAGALAAAPLATSRPARADDPAPPDPTKVPGEPVGAHGGYGVPSPFETARRLTEPSNPSPLTSWAYTPLADLVGNITPSGLHYERDHCGVPTIDPRRHR